MSHCLCLGILLENCIIPDNPPPQPTTDNVTAENEAFCYAACADRVRF